MIRTVSLLAAPALIGAAGPTLPCLQEKCALFVGTCKLASGCNKVIQCMEPCNDANCENLCFDDTSGAGTIAGADIAVLSGCGGANGCFHYDMVAKNSAAETTAKFSAGDIEKRFKEFETIFEKKYASVEQRLAGMKNFAVNLEKMALLARMERGDATYSHLTPYADMSGEEFSRRLGFKSAAMPLDAPVAASLQTSTLPDSFDWRSKGGVNPVKNQGGCGSCWAFATVDNIEGAGFVSTGKLLSLSEQELVDCDRTKGGDAGCKGGLPSNAYKYLISAKLGLETESSYAYTGKDTTTCKAQAAAEKSFIGGWQAISTDEDQIAASLMKFGTLAIGINAGPLQLYFGGIMDLPKFLCNPASLDHGVAIVGFGSGKGLLGTPKPYWIIRNSWGASWGEKGYFRIARGKGACGLNTMVTTATNITITASAIVV